MAVAERVAFCGGCLLYLPVDSAGSRCPGAECERLSDGQPRRLRVRVGYICRDCDGQPIFWSRGALRRHEMESH